MLIPEDNKHFIIRDKATGIEYDIREKGATVMLNEASQMLTKLPEQRENKPWDEWWCEKREHNYQLQNASENGDVKTIKDLLNKEKYGDLIANINAKGLDDFTALHFAVLEGHIEAVKELLRHKPYIDSCTTSNRTPLHMACNRGNIDIIQDLVNANADINLQDQDGNTPCHILSNLGYGKALTWLLMRNPDITIKNACGETPVEISSNIEIQKIFVTYSKTSSENTYSRTVMEGVLLHNNRADMIKSFMFRAQLLGTPSESKAEVKAEPKPEPRNSQRSTNRVVKILEIVEKMKIIPSEDSKESPKKEEEEEDLATTDDFEVLNLLGKGSFGEVYLVRHKKTGKMYAMKCLDKKRMMSQNILKYTKTECNVLRVTRHPFIVGLHYAFQNSEKLFMIMEYCPG